ncbi:glucokinase [Legionella antarctica]|uniref:Glucokinase n=1 Tax=Legionella antarctica TaxID=2708020 RepID=A0A6F8T1K4_9GAMM|nr:glucokinase [Legionella antarctica]BCA94103.1 glucokinase [Legionella antarctica]
MMDYKMPHYAIVADIGGTFARFSRVNLDNLHLDKIEIYPCSEFISLESVLMTYQTQHLLQDVRQVAIAIACPVINDVVCMTNCHWRFSIQALQHRLGLSKLAVINDFTAIAMSLPALENHEVIQIGNGHADVSKTKVVLGAGTGLGVAYLLPEKQGYKSYAGEGGHADWGAKTEQEWFIYSYLKTTYDHISHERLLSGQGLENLYQAIAAFHKKGVDPLSAAQIISLAKQQCPIAQASIGQFFASLGAYAGDLALTLGAFGGIYIAGGIVPRLLSLIQQSDFRARFESKGRFSDFNRLIPTYVVTAKQPGILGAAVYLKQSLVGEFDVVS